MSEEQKKLIEETVENLKHLDKESLLVVKGSVEVLKARDAMEKEESKDFGTSNFLEDMIEKKEKVTWMIRAHLE